MTLGIVTRTTALSGMLLSKLCQSEYRLSILYMQVHTVRVQIKQMRLGEAWLGLKCISKHTRHVPRKTMWPLCCALIGDSEYSEATGGTIPRVFPASRQTLVAVS